MDNALAYAWGQYRTWAITSRIIKKHVDRWGFFVLILTIVGTLLGAMSPFVKALPWIAGLSWADAAPGWVAGAAALALGIATFFSTQVLGDSARRDWTRARALAEALKSESYRYVTEAKPYDGKDAGTLLVAKANELLNITDGMLAESVSDEERVKNLPKRGLTIPDYMNQRVRDQIDRFYRPAIERHRRALYAGRTLALVLGGLSVVLSVKIGNGAATGSSTWVAALFATVTTAAASISAWFQGGNHLQTALNYQAAIAKLELLLARYQEDAATPIVTDAEAIFQAEHAAWLSGWQAGPEKEKHE